MSPDAGKRRDTAERRGRFTRFVTYAADAGRTFDGLAESRFYKAWIVTTRGTPEHVRFAEVIRQLDAAAPRRWRGRYHGGG